MAVMILAVALVPRVVDLGVFLTADEKNWIGRSYEFIRAFKEWRFNEMLQTTHPGVTTLWLGGLVVTVKMLAAHVPFTFSNLIHFVRAAQLSIAVTNAGLVLIVFILLRKLWPKRRMVAVLAALMIALDPFLVGYSRVVHVDAMLGGFMMAAGIAILLWAKRGFGRKWLVLSAVFTALAGLTKAPAVFLLPYFVLVALVFGRKQWENKRFWVDRFRDLIVWMLLIGIIVVIVWPAILWVPNPEGNVLVLKRDFSVAAATPHNMNSEYKLNSSFYWYTLVSRATPLTLFLVAVALINLLLAKGLRGRQVATLGRVTGADETAASKPETTNTLWLLVEYIFFFIVMMSLGAKKGDRYILPVFYTLDILAAWGAWYLTVGTVNLVARFTKFIRTTRTIVMAALMLVIAAQMGIVLYQYHPYAIAYSNPLLPDNLSQELGWGEGLEQVGKWLNEHDPEVIVASWYPEELGVYTSAHVAHINAHEQSRVKYVVLYRNMFGREPDHYANDFIDEYYKKKVPVYVVEVAGKQAAWVYEKKVYDRVLNELKAGQAVSQAVEVKQAGLVGLDIMAATFSGQAKEGYLEVEVDSQSGQKIGSWRLPVTEINDRGWTSFMLEQPIVNFGIYKVIVKATETGEKAPTVRYRDGREYRSASMVVNGQDKPGNLAVRLRYKVGNEIVTEDDKKLLD